MGTNSGTEGGARGPAATQGASNSKNRTDRRRNQQKGCKKELYARRVPGYEERLLSEGGYIVWKKGIRRKVGGYFYPRGWGCGREGGPRHAMTRR